MLERDVVGPLRMDPANVHVPDGAAADLAAACADYEARIAATGPVDLQILGIGANGHIGFNEPTSSFASRTRIKTLAPKTRADNARFFDSPDQVPMHCLTQGLGTILDARTLVLVAQGEAKADAVARMVEGPVSSMLYTRPYFETTTTIKRSPRNFYNKIAEFVIEGVVRSHVKKKRDDFHSTSKKIE